MLHSFLLIDEFQTIRKRQRMHTASFDEEPAPGGEPPETVPEAKLRNMGLRVYVALTAKEMASMLDLVDAVILSVQPERMLEWRKQVTALRPVPILLWCDHLTFPSSGCKLDTELDGMLTATMSPSELHCSLLLGFNQFIERRGWQQEREQLLSKLEERKWIDQAKTVLCEVKQISEAEAYDFLRKQAMNERKRIVDVATSIVKVYQLLRDQKQGGR